MNDSGSYGRLSLETSLALERARLVRLCAKITGDRIIAEDLAQETLLEAWRHIDNLRSQEKLPQWLSGIAHNVCLRWARRRGRDLLQLAEPLRNLETPQAELEDTLVDDFDLEVEWESLESLVFALPQVQQFYRQHPRAHFLPTYEVEVDGRAAIVTTIESITNQGKVAVVSAAATYELLRHYVNNA